MEDLHISIKGEITSSNFDEWKSTIIQRIDATPTELVTDEDFAHADGSVKSYKLIEKKLDDVKQSALDQSGDITNLFEAIDDVKGRVRDVRLKLNRQVTQRKKEIRLDLIDAAIQRVRQSIKTKAGVFPLLDHSDILNDWDFESAIKGRSSLRNAQSALKKLIDEKLSKVEKRLTKVKLNETLLDAASKEYAFLFNDKKSLLLMNSDELEKLIERRILNFRVHEDASPRFPPPPANPHCHPADRNSTQPSTESPVGAAKLTKSEFVLVLKQLANGISPFSGKHLPQNSTMNNVDTVRVLYSIVEELEKPEHQPPQPPQESP